MSKSSSSSSSSSAEPKRPKTDGLIISPTVAQYPNNNGVQPADFSKRSGITCCPCVKFVIQCVLVAALGSFLFGFNLSLLNTSLASINVDYGWCEREKNGALTTVCTKAQNFGAFISTAVFIGAAIGSMSGGRFLALGRRMMLLMSMAVFCFGIVSSVVANSFSSLLWARLVVGYGVGLVSVVSPTYIAEMTPKEKRGTYGVMHQLLITVGIFVAVLIGLPLENPNGEADWSQPTFSKIWWRVMLGLGIVPVLMAAYLLAFTYTHETPHYYCANRQYDDATNLLRIIYGRTDVAEEVHDITTGLKEAERAKKEGLSLTKAMGQSDYLHVILVACLLSAFQQLSGINVFIAQSNALFAAAGFEGAAVTGFSVALTGINCLMTFPAMYLIEKLGRKTLLLIGTMGQLIGVAPAAIMYWVNSESEATQWAAIAGAIVFIIFFAVAYGPVLWVYLFEIFPAEIRGAAAGAATAVNWVCGIVMVFVTNYISNQIAYTVFMIMCGVAFLVSLLLVRETKGRSIDDSPYLSKDRVKA